MNKLHHLLVATQLLEGTEGSMGIALQSHSVEEDTFVNELKDCLTREEEFKRINLQMHVPSLMIQPYHHKESYNDWVIILVMIFVTVMLLGLSIELCKKAYYKKKRAVSVAATQMYHENMGPVVITVASVTDTTSDTE